MITDPEPYPVAYLRVGGGKLIKKEGWTRPSIRELRGMLGLDGVTKGEEGLDEASTELLSDLKASSGSASMMGGTSPSQAGEVGHDGLETGAEGVRFNKRGRWFGVSISGKTQGDEDIGQELDRCFQSINRKLLPSYHFTTPPFPSSPYILSVRSSRSSS